MHELHRVFDGDHVLALRRVDLVNHRGERGGLARPGGARDEHEAILVARELSKHRGERQALDGGHLVGDDPKHGPHAVRLAERVDAEAPDPFGGVGEVELVVVREGVLLLFGENLVNEALGLVGRERAEGQRDELAVVADDGHVAGVKVQVARPLLDHEAQE